MLNSSRDKINKYSNSCVVRKINSEQNKKPYPPPPLQVNWSAPKETPLGNVISPVCPGTWKSKVFHFDFKLQDHF